MLPPHKITTALKKYGSVNKAADALDVPRTTLKRWIRKMRAGDYSVPELVERRAEPKPRKGKVKRYIFTAAQNQTPIHAPFWNNLTNYAQDIGAELIVSGFTYTTHLSADATFDERVQPYLSRVQLNVADKLLFCGEINISPTAANPLSGLETYTRDKWGVFPHPRVELRSVATMFGEPAKQIMTTGCCTQPNYLPRKAGVKAEFHHVIGALLVEVDGAGSIFCRHLIADDTGGFYDLDTYVADGVSTSGHIIRAITWGDLHAEEIDPDIAYGGWVGPKNLLDTLKPAYQFIHDLSDFSARNHHNVKDPHWRFKRWRNKQDCVAAGLNSVASTLLQLVRPDVETIVVESNHDLMLQRWLREEDFRDDPTNARFYLRASKALYDAIDAGDDNFSVFEWAMREYIGSRKDVTFLRESSSFKVGTIEYALHGHKGANGAKGHINSYARMGSKANVAHTHSAAIHEGIYQAGTSSKLDLGYNRGGLSSWNHAHILTYPNGKRVIITMQGQKWRA